MPGNIDFEPSFHANFAVWLTTGGYSKTAISDYGLLERQRHRHLRGVRDGQGR